MGLLDGLIGAAQGVGQAGKQYTDASIEEDRRAREAQAAQERQQQIAQLQHTLGLERDAVNNDRADTRQGAGFSHAENMLGKTQEFERTYKDGDLDLRKQGILLQAQQQAEGVRHNKASEGLQARGINVQAKNADKKSWEHDLYDRAAAGDPQAAKTLTFMRSMTAKDASWKFTPDQQGGIIGQGPDGSIYAFDASKGSMTPIEAVPSTAPVAQPAAKQPAQPSDAAKSLLYGRQPGK